MFKKLLVGLVLGIASFSTWAGSTTIYASAARTASSNGADIVRTSEKWATFVVVISVAPGGDTVTFTVQGKDVLGNYYTILASSALASTGTTLLNVGPGLANTTNVSIAMPLPDVYRVITTHSAGTSFTYTVTENSSQ